MATLAVKFGQKENTASTRKVRSAMNDIKKYLSRIWEFIFITDTTL